MIKDTFKTIGELEIVLIDDKGKVKERLVVPNLVVNTGKNFITHRMISGANNVMNFMAIGSDSASPAVEDIALGSEVARVGLTSAQITSPGNRVSYVAAFNPGTPATLTGIREAAIFNDPSGGEMLCRTVFSVVNKDLLDTLTITWTVTNN